jgi:hypothetical protein
MSGQGNVGTSGVYEAGDQRNPPASEQNKATPYEEGKENAHDQNDPSESTSRVHAFVTNSNTRGPAVHRQPPECC